MENTNQTYANVMPVFDPETGTYEDAYPAFCNCGAPLTILEVKALGSRCSSCEMHYIEEEQKMQEVDYE